MGKHIFAVTAALSQCGKAVEAGERGHTIQREDRLPRGFSVSLSGQCIFAGVSARCSGFVWLFFVSFWGLMLPSASVVARFWLLGRCLSGPRSSGCLPLGYGIPKRE